MTVKEKYFQYLLVFLIVGITGFRALYFAQIVAIIFLVALCIVPFFQKKLSVDTSFIYIYTFFIILTIYHSFINDDFPIFTLLGFFLRILSAYLVIKVLGINFIEIYKKLIYYLCIISFLFYVPSLLSSSVLKFFLAHAPININEGGFHPNYILYNFNIGDSEASIIRNCGPFWEPGAFGGFLVIALLLLWFSEKTIFNKTGYVYIFALLTTFSTTAYIAFFILLLMINLLSKNRLISIALLPIVVYLGFAMFWQLDFLGTKIEEQLQRAETGKAYYTHRTRMTSFELDLIDWTERPLFGTGKFSEERNDDPLFATNRSNGTSDILLVFGLVGFSVFFGNYRKSFRKLLQYYKWDKNKILILSFFAVFMFLLIGFSENYFLRGSFFWIFVFFSLFSTKKDILNSGIGKVA